MLKKYMTFFDLLGTKNFSMDRDNYFDNINVFRKRIIDNVSYLSDNQNLYNVSFFSDCCYVESEDLNCLFDYLMNLRDDLLSKGLFFNAAVIKVEYEGEFTSFEITKLQKGDNRSVAGTLFNSNFISKVYDAQNKFKGIGIWISPDIIEESRSIDSFRKRIINSFYVEDTKFPSSVQRYFDIKINITGTNIEKQYLNTIIKAYYFACCENPRAGRYYVSLLINAINSDNSNIFWSINEKRFEKTSYIYNLIFDILRDKEQYELLTGFEFIAFAFINKIFNSNLSNSEINIVVKEFLSPKSIAHKYITDLDHIPVELLRNTKDDNVLLFKEYCRQYILSDKVSKYTIMD